MIELMGVCKSFNHQPVLDHVTLQMEAGKVHGLTGDNGSGKSVLLKCICGLLPIDEGSIRIDGKPVVCGGRNQPEMGIVIEHPGFLDAESGYRNLKYLAGIRGRIGRAEILQMLDKVGLTNAASKPVKKYSLGMRQRLAIAQALMEDPPVLIMDEPFNGLDRTAAAEIRRLLLLQRDLGKTILLVSHYASDIDTLCDHVCRIENGKVMPG